MSAHKTPYQSIPFRPVNMNEDEEDDAPSIESLRDALRNDPSHKYPKHFSPTTANRPHQPYPKPVSQPVPHGKGNNSKPSKKDNSPKVLIQYAILVYEWVDELFKSFGIVAGGIATSLADWIFGAVTMVIMLSGNSAESSREQWASAFVFSLALWGIQIVLWRVVLTGKLKSISQSSQMTFWLYVVVFVGIALMKLGDDFSDIVGVFWLIRENPMQFFLATNVYKTLLGVIFFLTWCICGFAEVFVALSINLLKEDKN
jgi:hypothetical protein